MVSLIDSRFIASCVGYVIPAVKRRKHAAELGRTPGRGDYAAPLACKKMRRILGVLTALRWRVLGAMALEHTGHCHELALIKCRTGSKLTVSAECVTPASSDFQGAEPAGLRSRQMVRCASLERTGHCHKRAKPVTCGHHTGRRRSRWQTYERSGHQLCCTMPVRFRQWGTPPPVHYGARKRRSDRPGSF